MKTQVHGNKNASSEKNSNFVRDTARQTDRLLKLTHSATNRGSIANTHTRTSESMRCEELVIFFSNLA